MQDSMKQEGFPFAFNPAACESCEGNCCIGESGYIWVTPAEIKDIAYFLNMQETDFREKHLRKIRYRYSLKEHQMGQSYVCEFFDIQQKQCTIYEVRPSQCRTFPFWDYFKTHIKEVEEECPGIIRY
jgi:Fe-S-cluster containining protein